ncbi:MAG TPA: Ig-like domain-containing protein [Anaerobutyricum hallii]|uniref:Ig-like domain-containing protein n=1 Tax=Anaerobutyricum hallii TaxID=39488 RepID=UPI00242F573A|nr:Ig-like domain-containing protein [Anaerobutyricum hallii]HJH97575.1 Ig-like domain-containing protein [Anaerobutyricum hallii]
MKKQVKNLFALFLTASMAVSLVPADAFAAVHDAVKDATTTTAYEKVEAEKKAAQPKAGSAEAAIQEALYTNTDEVDLSKYNLTERKAEKLTDKSLGENKDTNLVDVTYETDANGKVTTMSVEKDDTYAYALEEIDELAADDAGEDDGSGKTKTEVGQAYKDLMAFYESPDNQEYLGIATPYFTSKDSKGGPVSSLLSLMQQKIYKEGDPEEENPANAKVTYKDMYDVIQGYQTTLQYGIQLFGQQLLAARDEALAQIDDSMTREQKLLVLNDWLGKYCTFDMGAIQEEQDKKNDTETTEEAIQAMGETAAVALADDGQQQPTEEQIAYLRNMLLNGDLKTAFESTAFGALIRRNTICAGYTSAYTYLVQCAFPEIYKEADGKTWKKASEVNGTDSSQDKKDDNSSSENKGDTSETDKEENSSAAETETQAADGEDSSGDASSEKKDETTTETKPTYIVDFVKIFWRSNVQMLGQSQTFRNSHYFNAVKTDDSVDNWYYVDSCYNDIYVECMGRNRVETDGNMTHSYFLISHTSLAKQFDGNFDEIDTLYTDKATDTKYEDAWFTDAQGPISFDKDNWYYVQNTTSYSSGMSTSNQKPDQLVSLPRTAAATATSDSATVLVDYEKGTGAVKKGGDLLKESATKDEDVNDKIYPGLTHTSAYYGGALYLNADNQILKYDLSTNAITKVKEYNEVTVKSVADNMGTGIENNFTGMTFKVTTKDDKDAIHTVENHPIAGLSIDSQGNLNVDIATNYCYVDKYQTEQTNYNSGYSNYKFQGTTIKRGGSNDNQEFMWSADFVESQKMSDVTGESHTHEYETVTVEPTCENVGFTEERCKTCGVVKADSKKESEAEDAKATGHHYIQYKDETYTKESDADDAKNIVVNAIVCTKCMKAIPRKSSGNSGNMFGSGDDSDELDIPEGLKTGHEYTGKITSLSDDKKKGDVTVSCDSCVGKELDFLDEKDVTLETKKDVEVTSKKEAEDCEKGGKIIYTAKVTVGDNEYEATTTEEAAAEKHVYKPKFTWADDNTCTVTYTCENCKIPETEAEKCEVTSEVTEPTCTEAGKTVYTATATDKNDTKHTDTKEVPIEAIGHTYSADPTYEWSKDYKTCKAIFTCDKKDDTQTVECTVTPATTDATCTEAGKVVYTATCTFKGKEYTCPEKKETTIAATDHTYSADPTYEWSKDYKTCKAIFTCDKKDDTQTVECTITSKTTDATYTAVGKVVYTATCTFKGKEYTCPEKKEVKGDQKDSKAKFAKTSYNLYSTQSGKVSLVSDYKQDGIVSIKSSNPSKVSVNTAGVIKAGVVKGKAVKVTITAVVKSGKTIKTVVTVAPTKITLNATSVPLQLKKSTSVIKVAKATLPGDQIASWSTSNKKVVTVSKSGKITAKKVGTAVVTITMKSGATAKCKVKVQKAAVKLTKIAVNSKKVNLNLKKGPKTYQLTATKTPITVVSKVTFTTSNKKVAVVSKSGKITAKKAGKAVITVKCAKKVQKVTVVVKAK